VFKSKNAPNIRNKSLLTPKHKKETFKYITLFFLVKKLKGDKFMVKRLIPLAAMEKILKESGADRVSDKAKTALKVVVEDLAEAIAIDAVKLASHAGRQTVKAGDIKLASRTRK